MMMAVAHVLLGLYEAVKKTKRTTVTLWEYMIEDGEMKLVGLANKTQQSGWLQKELMKPFIQSFIAKNLYAMHFHWVLFFLIHL